MKSAFWAVLAALAVAIPPAWAQGGEPLELHGYLSDATYLRVDGTGLSKERLRALADFAKDFGAAGAFSSVKVSGVVRISYDAEYRLNDDHWGDRAGSSVQLGNTGGPSAVVLQDGTNSASLPWGQGWGSAVRPLPGSFGFNTVLDPNSGLTLFNRGLTGGTPGFGGLQFAYPLAPCNKDRRGCISGYLDSTLTELEFPDFNHRQDWLRELYADLVLPLGHGARLTTRIGRQQVVWGRTDLFRVLDVINPVDYSIQNIYEPLNDSRLPTGILNSELQLGARGPFQSLNVQLVWQFEQFRPDLIGQGGQPYAIAGVGNLFRALSTCWNYGCTVGNFAPNNLTSLTGVPSTGTLAVDFGPHVLGIRQANLPAWSLNHSPVGLRLEGEAGGFGFSVNGLYSYAQLPVLHGGVPALNPFLPAGGANQPVPVAYLPAFDIVFPRVVTIGGSVDTYLDSLKSTFRLELAHTHGEEFADTLQPNLYKESGVVRWVLGWDRPTWIPFLNASRTFLVSAQIFGQHILQHELIQTALGPAGMPDWKDNFIGTLLVQGNYLSDRLTPQIITAYDTRGQGGAIAPSVTWLASNHIELNLGGNFKWGRADKQFDDLRAANQFPPFTGPLGAVGQSQARTESIAPLGAFRSGVIGEAFKENEVQFNARYKF